MPSFSESPPSEHSPIEHSPTKPMQIETGFILTRQARDLSSPPRTQIELWIATDNGAVQLFIEDEKPVFFIETSQQSVALDAIKPNPQHQYQQHHQQIKPIALKTFENKDVSACYSVTQRASQQLIQTLKQAQVITYETDIRLIDRYLMERFIYGGTQVVGTPIYNADKPNFNNRFDSVTPDQTALKVHQSKAVDYRPNLSMVSLDIECSEKGILYSVGLDSVKDSRVIMIGSPEAINHKSDDDELNIEYLEIEWVENENALLTALEDWFEKFDPDVLIGWNVINFDCQLLVKRAQWHKRTLNTGRGRRPLTFRQSNTSQLGFANMAGRVVIDGIDGLKTATYGFSSWSLENVAQALLNQGKTIESSGEDKMAEINRLYAQDKPALARYNLQDCKLVTQIFQHTHLLDFLVERTRLTGIELDRLGGSVASFTNLYLPKLHRSGYIAPNLHSENWFASPGGYVMDSKPGLYHSVLVLDFKSLYPSIIRTFLIDPLGLVEGLKLEAGRELNQAVEGFRGGQFHREKHHLPAIIETLWQARDEAKKNNEAAFSQAIKIIMNSFYGVLGSSGCRFFDTRLASSITLRGQSIMKQTQVLIEQQGYEVIYGDTDSIFVSLTKPNKDADANTIGQSLVSHINQWWQQHLQDDYQLPCFLELEYETHYKRFLMPTIRGAETGSKKRYCGLKTHKNKHSEVDDIMIYKGLESARSDWTPLSQHFQQTLYRMVFDDKDPQTYIRQTVEDTLAGKFYDQLIYQKRLRRALHEYQKNIPPQVRAARLADEINAKLGKPLQYQNKGRIEYIFTLNGPEPKEYRESAIDYQHYIDKQLKPVADAILPFIGLDFESIIAPQIGLF